MSYATATTILTILPGLPQTSTSAGYSSTVSIITSHIGRADSIIDGMLAKRYSVPFSSAPPLVKTISEDIGSAFAYRSFFTQDNYNKSEYFAELITEAKDLLREIAKGDIDLVDSSGNVISEREDSNVSVCESTTQNFTPTFLEDTSTSWEVSQDKLDLIGDER